MANKDEHPKVRKVADDENIETHPAYGQIRVGRISGQTCLYGSDFRHQHFVGITIARSELRRDLSHDWHHATDELIEVWMSEAQWAAFVASVGEGSGITCTLNHAAMKQIPSIADVPNRRKQFKQELEERLSLATKAMEELDARIDAATMSKTTKSEMHSELETVRRNVLANIDWLAQMFEEHMEKTVERGKTEIATFINNTLLRAGLKAVKGDGILKMIGHDKEDTK